MLNVPHSGEVGAAHRPLRKEECGRVLLRPSLQTASPGQHAAVLPVAVRAGLTGRCYGKRVTAGVPTAFWVTRPIVKPCTRMEKTTTQ